MGFFTRFPDAIRHLGISWRGLPPTVQPSAAVGTLTTSSVSVNTCETPHTVHTAPVAKPPQLRTICASESRLGQRSKAVRVVISGRMADVCAELDRLVALEAQPTLH